MKFFAALLIVVVIILSCNEPQSDWNNYGSSVKGYYDKKGHYHKPHFRKRHTTNPNALKNQNRSRYYYHTKGKYLRRK